VNVEDVCVDEENLKKAKKLMYNNFPRSKLPTFAVEGRLPTSEEIKRHMLYVKRDPSPGLPFAELAQTKGELLDKHSELIIDVVLDRMASYSEYTFDHFTAQQLVERGFADPVRLFVKNEPHPIEKIKTGRYRLISSCSIIDELIFSLLYRNAMDCDVLEWRTIPSKSGMGLSSDAQQQAVYDYVEPWIDEVRSSDVSGWDWSFLKWLMDANLDVHFDLTESRDNHFYRRLCENSMHVLSNSVFATSNGHMFVVDVCGIMKSGFPITAFWNSRGRAMVAYLTGATKVATMGDDCNDNSPRSSIVDDYKALGFRLTDVSEPDGKHFEFCSHRFCDGVAVPLNPLKSFCNLLMNPYEVSFLEQFRHEMRNLPELPRLVEIYHRVQRA